MKNGPGILSSKYWWLLLLFILIGVNYLASVFHARFDLTKEKRYTLSRATGALVKNLDDVVYIDVFLKGEFNAGFRKLANSTKEFLNLLKDRNSSKIRYRFISPLEKLPNGVLWGDSLMNMGALNIDLTFQKKEGQNRNIIFPVALLTYKGQQSLVNLFPGASSRISQDDINSAEAMMEYQFLKTLDKMTHVKRSGIGYSIGNGEPVDHRTYDLRTTLGTDYDFRIVDLHAGYKVPDSVDILLIVKPTIPFTENEILKIDQFVMRGGKLFLSIDNLIAEQDSLLTKPETIAYDRNLGLTDFLFRYGVRINTDLVMDLQCDVIPIVVAGTQENPQIEYLHWNYYPFLNSVSRIAKGRGYISGHFVNSIDTIKSGGIRKEALLVTSPNSRTISTPALISLNENKDAPEDEKFKKNAIPVAMLLEGKFTSFYFHRVMKSQLDSLVAGGEIFRESSPANKIIVVADGDILLNDFMPAENNARPQPLPMGWNRFTYQEYLNQTRFAKFFIPTANREFMLNCVEYLVSNPAISETRNKDIVLRLLDSKKVKTGKTTWQLINIALPILLVILCGWVYQEIRKRKYQ